MTKNKVWPSQEMVLEAAKGAKGYQEAYKKIYAATDAQGCIRIDKGTLRQLLD